MNRDFKRHFAVGCLLAAGLMAGRPLNGETLDDTPRFTVRLYNYARVGRGTLTRAKAATSRVFRRAGIQLVWVDCPIAPEDIRVCSRIDGTPWVQLNILPEKMAKRFGDPNDVFGTAFGSIAFVYFHHVQELADQYSFTESLVLGHVMAHELGHVLLGPGGHSSSGVMIANLKRTDLPIVVKGRLAFNSEQATRMRTHLRQPDPAVSSAPTDEALATSPIL